jgi:hypothetical protein
VLRCARETIVAFDRPTHYIATIMRAETAKLLDEIKQSLVLLRRHL